MSWLNRWVLALVCLHLVGVARGQNFYIGTPEQIATMMTMDRLSSGLDSLKQYGQLRGAMIQEIQTARADYWDAFASGVVPPATRQRYLDALYMKDMFYFNREAVNLIGGRNESGTMGLGDAVDLLGGGMVQGEFDDGLVLLSSGQFKEWCETLLKVLLAAKSDTDMLACRNAYLNYVASRDLGEYLYRNPHSPLLSEDPETFFKAWLVTVGLAETWPEARTVYLEMSQVLARGEMVKVMAEARTIVSPADLISGRAFEHVGAKLICAGAKLDYAVATLHPELRGAYFTKRRYRTTWAVALQIHEVRRKHGTSPDPSLTREAFAKRIDQETVAQFTTPNARFSGVIPPRFSRLLPDPHADAFGPMEIWRNLEAKAAAVPRQANGDYTRFADSLRADAANSKSQVDMRKLEFLGPDLLRRAANSAAFLPTQNLRGYAGHHPQYYQTGESFAVDTINAAKGFAYLNEDWEVIAILFLSEGESGSPYDQLLSGRQRYLDLCQSSGKDVVLAAIRNTFKEFGFQTFEGLRMINFRTMMGDGDSRFRFNASLENRNQLSAQELATLRASLRTALNAYKAAPPALTEASKAEVNKTYPILNDKYLLYRDNNLRAYAGTSKGAHKVTIIWNISDDTPVLYDAKFEAYMNELLLPIFFFRGYDPGEHMTDKTNVRIYVENFTENQYAMAYTRPATIPHGDPIRLTLFGLNMIKLRKEGDRWVLDKIMPGIDEPMNRPIFESFEAMKKIIQQWRDNRR